MWTRRGAAGVFILSLEHLSSFSRESRGVRLNVRDDSFPKSVVVRDSGGEPWQRRPRRHHVPVLVVLLLFPLVLLLVDLLTPPDIRLGPVMVAAPVFSAAFPGVLLVILVTTPCGYWPPPPTSSWARPTFPSSSERLCS